jgi:hypothetical protein
MHDSTKSGAKCPIADPSHFRLSTLATDNRKDYSQHEKNESEYYPFQSDKQMFAALRPSPLCIIWDLCNLVNEAVYEPRAVCQCLTFTKGHNYEASGFELLLYGSGYDNQSPRIAPESMRRRNGGHMKVDNLNDDLTPDDTDAMPLEYHEFDSGG